MKILAIKSSGDCTSISVILDGEINSYSQSHERKERPDWDLFLANVGHNKLFSLKDIDLFAYANSQSSYTATRAIASYMKGISVGLNKPLMVVDDPDDDNLEADSIAKIAKEKFLSADSDHNNFDPNFANPSYLQETNFRKIDE